MGFRGILRLRANRLFPQVSLPLHRLTRLAQPPKRVWSGKGKKARKFQLRCALYPRPEGRGFTARWISNDSFSRRIGRDGSPAYLVTSQAANTGRRALERYFSMSPLGGLSFRFPSLHTLPGSLPCGRPLALGSSRDAHATREPETFFG